MYADIVTKMGRPKRQDPTDRVNFKLNSKIRIELKILAAQDGRSESAEIERLVIEGRALRNIFKKNPEVAATILPLLNSEVSEILETLEQENTVIRID